MTIPVLFPTAWTDYKLLDSGGGQKFEEFSGYKVIRPDPRAIWQPQNQNWQADAVFDRNSANGRWIYNKQAPGDWRIDYRDLKFRLRPTDFRHVGIFPEQAANWDWLSKQIAGRPLKVLNLFAYTGGATLAAAKAGAKVTHVDGSKPIISWANRNCELNNLPKDSVRWILEDASKFVDREVRRGSAYDGIILDPPRFGHGAGGEIWKLENNLSSLVESCKKLLVKNGNFMILNAYTADLSSIALHQLVADEFKNMGGKVESFELAIQEIGENSRLLPSGVTIRWNR